MDIRGNKLLARNDGEFVTPNNRNLVGSTALSAMKARQDRQFDRLSRRSDRFSQLISGSVAHDFVADTLVGRSALSGGQRNELLALAPVASHALRAEVADRMSGLRQLLRPLDPLLTTGQISFNHTFGSWGNYYEPSSDKREASVEIVAGIFATQASTETARPSSEKIQMIEDQLVELGDAQLLCGLAEAISSTDNDGYLRMASRSRWTNVRGEAYGHHGRDLATAIFSPIGAWMREEFGFTVEEFYAVADAAVDLVHQRVNDHLQSHLEQVSKLITSRVGLPNDQHLGSEGLFESLFATLPAHMLLTVDDIAHAARLSEQLVERILNELSTSVGERSEADYRSPLDEYPLRQTPFLRAGHRYVLPIGGQLFRSPQDLFEARLLATRPTFSQQRARVVDETTCELLAKALPGASVATGLHYRFDDGNGLQDHETDGIVIFEDFCLIVEGKASRLSAQAQRGDLARLQRDIARTLEKAWDQCARVHRYLATHTPATFTNRRGERIIEVADPLKLRVLYINPMLHSLGVFAHELPRLRALGLFPDEGLPWPVLVTDLRVIVEMITTPAELLHYLVWRNSLPIGETMTAVDELDIFGAYLFGQVGTTDVDHNEHVYLGSATTDFDAYYASEIGSGPLAPRPRRVLGDWFEESLLDLAARRPPGWLETSFAILDLPLQEAAQLTAYCNNRARRELRGRRWTSSIVGNSALVVLAADIAPTDVLLEIAQVVPASTRRFIARAHNRGFKLLMAQRSDR